MDAYAPIHQEDGDAEAGFDGPRAPLPVGLTDLENAILAKLIGVVFDEAMSRIVRAFEERARKLYG